MEGQRTEVTAAVAATVADQGEFYLIDGRDSAKWFVGRMIGAHIRKCIHGVHLLNGKRLGRRILHDIYMVVRLAQPLCGEGIRILILCIEALCKHALVCLDLVVRRQHDRIVDKLLVLGLKYGSVNKGDILNRDSCL